MTESQFSTKLKKDLEGSGFYVYKIPDPSGAFASTSKRPMDWFVVKGNIVHFIELKIIHINKRDKFSVDIKKIADHQFSSLYGLYLQGFPNCWVVYGVQCNKTKRLLGCLAFHISDIKKFIENNEFLPKKSVEDLFLYNKGIFKGISKLWSCSYVL